MHASTFQFHSPTDAQRSRMNTVREAATNYAAILDANLPDGPDKTYTLRALRDVAMWANVTITRHPDGSPREE